MSALVGIIQSCDQAGSYQEVGRLMMQALEQYPSDDIGTWSDEFVFLGCHNQWVTPQSVDEKLPVYNERYELAITSDAIIDNRDELFHLLQIDREKCDQITDSDLILAAYRKWGADTPKYLIGDYAFIIWDPQKRMLFGARDLFGTRTLYYYDDPEKIAFCTIVSPLFAVPGIRKQLHEEWFAEYLAIPTMLDSTSIVTTAYRQIKQIPPAHFFTVKNGKISVTSFGTPLPEKKLKLAFNEEYEEAFVEVFEKAVASRLRTHRKAGATLSGGLDSGMVAGMAARLQARHGQPLHTFSAIPVPDFVDWTSASRLADERPLIKETVDFVGNMSENHFAFFGKNPYSELDEWLDILQFPYKNFENSHWVKGMYEEAAKQGIGVLLTGAAGNFSVSWGSAAEYYVHLLRKLHWIRFYRELRQYSRHMNMGRLSLTKRLGKFAFLNPTNRTIGQMNIPSMISQDFAKKTNVFEQFSDKDIGLDSKVSMFNERESFFLNLAAQHMRGSSCTKLSLKYSLWERDPCSDSRVVKFCLSLPLDQFVQNGRDRSLIRRASKLYLPDSVRLNQRTRGVQGADWLHRTLPMWGLIINELRELLEDKSASAYFNLPFLTQTLEKYGNSPKPEQAFDSDIRYLMRILIAYRFLKRF